MPDAQLDRLLLALRATGPDAYRADPDRIDVWRAYCPACSPVEARRLTVRERADGTVTVSCSLGCSTRSIVVALALAERRYPRTWAGHESPADAAAVAEVELGRLVAQRRVVAALAREAA